MSRKKHVRKRLLAKNKKEISNITMFARAFVNRVVLVALPSVPKSMPLATVCRLAAMIKAGWMTALKHREPTSAEEET